MKKELMLLLFALVLLNLELVAAADVAYIYRKNFRIDDNILNILNQSGLSVDLIRETSLPSNFNNYRLILVGDENFRNVDRIPVNSKPSIVVNYYHGEDWGLTDSEGISSLAANHPLSVVTSNRIVQVYDAAKSSPPGGEAIPYYFLDEGNKAPVLQTVATTETSASGEDYGDVIAYANVGDRLLNGKTQGGKLCFYGIVESDHWTSGARQLFNDCLSHVASQCSTNADCPAPSNSTPFCQNGDVYKNTTSYMCQNSVIRMCVPTNSQMLLEDCLFGCSNGACLAGIHDVALLDFDSVMNKIKITNSSGDEILGSTLLCKQQYDVVVQVTNLGQLTENVTFNASIGNLSFTHAPENNLVPEEIVNKTRAVTINLPEGFYNLSVRAIIPEDNFPSNNLAMREIFVSCPPILCRANSDCGTDGYLNEPMCTANNSVSRDFISFTCNNPNTPLSFCTNSTERRIVEQCSSSCSNGACVPSTCDSDSDCNDNNPLTNDSCLNPGTPASVCVNTPINCASNADCGSTGFIGEEFCSLNNSIAKNFKNSTCIDAGTPNSHCIVEVEEETLNQCQYACFEGGCIRCDMNSDCSDGNSQTQDICNLPGTTQSFCTNVPSNEPIACTQNSDCGAISILSPNFCSTTSVISRLVSAWTCNNAGTTQSYCSSRIQIENIQTCSQFCNNGQCQSISCYVDSDCNDGIPSTQDRCMNPGTPQSFCSHNPSQPVACTYETDCGIDGFVGGNYCSANTLVRNFVDYTCNNAGTISSYCSSQSSTRLIQDCPAECMNNQCVVQTECTPGQTRECGVSNVGQCRLGTETCSSSGNWGACVGAIYPSTEMCDGQDNDCDGVNNENSVCPPAPQCQDGIDNDNDGLTDFPADPGCNSRTDNSESPANLPPQCNDGIDNDGDGFTDFPADRGCSSNDDNTELPINLPPSPKQCDDGIDNDNNGFIDFPADSGCNSRTDNLENN